MREIDPHLPIDKTAAFVVSKSNKQGLDFKCGDKIYSMTPLPTRQFPGLKEHDLTGRKCGAFRVIGCSLWVPRNYLTSRANTIRWVVKCKCGRYAILTTKAVKKNHPDTACDECKKVMAFMRVQWFEKFACFCLVANRWDFPHFFAEAADPDDCEVIGNSFEHPHLLQ